MHFSIPDTSEVGEKSANLYTVFNVHINGVYHCSVRYKLFHNFHEQLKKEFGASILPPFPPKKLLNLTPAQLEDRRLGVERYIQIVSQNAEIASSPTFNNFLLTAQQHSQKAVSEDVTLDVYLMNGHKISVDIVSTDQTDDILETIASKIELADEYVYYFGLFLMKKEDVAGSTIVRQLQEFESPYISLQAANKTGPHRIVIRKSFWDPSYDEELIGDRVAMNLLHVQAVADVSHQWVVASPDQFTQLKTLQQKNSKKEYLRYARTLKYYGYIRFIPCTCDYPEPNSKVTIFAGNRELNFRISVKGGEKEISFKVTRMRCWRITSVYPEANGEDFSTSGRPAYNRLELSFEYLMCKDTLQWITVTSDQAILMSMSLQGMVDELIMKKNKQPRKKPSDRPYSKRRTQSITSSLPNYSSTNKVRKASVQKQNSSGSVVATSGGNPSLSTSTSYLRSVSNFSYASGTATENEVFNRDDGINDDDL